MTEIKNYLMNSSREDRISFLFCALVLCSINLFCKFHVSNTLIYYLSSFLIIILSFICIFKDSAYKNWYLLAPLLYTLWTLYEIIRGVLVVDSYWVFNQLIHGTLDTLPPIIIFLLSSPKLCLKILQNTSRFIVFIGILFFGWCLPISAYSFLMVPFFYLYSCFLNKIPKKWRWITIVIIIIVGTAWGNRSGVIKVVFSLGVFLVSILPKYLRLTAIHIGHSFFYTIAFILLFLGLTGRYNIFDSDYFNEKGLTVTVFSTDDKIQEDNKASDLTIDTRTLLYVETITTAFDYDCIWTGRTPAHGYISPWFTVDGPVQKGRDPSERFSCEVAHLNTFTWLGLTGLILMFLVYFQGSFLALFYSNNYFIKCIGLTVSFEWMYGWIENWNQFFIMDLMIFILLSLCYSPIFRKMTDKDFLVYFVSIFDNPTRISLFEKYNLTKKILLIKIIKNRENRSLTRN